MENYKYGEVKTDSRSIRHYPFCGIFFFRQLLVCSVLWIAFFLGGICIGAPTVYIPQIRKEANSTDAISDNMASLLMAIYGYSGVPWVIILPISATYLGRKKPFIFVAAVMVIACTVFYTSNSVPLLLINQAMESVMGASLITISTMVMSEYTSPKYRGFFLTFKSASYTWGIWVSNAIGTFFHWKYIGLVKVILSIYPIVVVFFWPESPYWLASKGKFQKCAESHRWLKGSSEESENELQRLISPRNKVAESDLRFSKVIMMKEFYKATLLSLCVLSLYSLSGKIACGFYSLDIIKKMTSSESTAYTGMLILDGVTVLGMYIGTVLSRIISRRRLFIFSSFIGIGTLFILSIHVYLVNLTILPENRYVSISLLSVYSMGIGCGPMILSSTLYAELLPLKGRSLAICVVALLDRFIWGSVIQVTSVVIRNLGLHSAFLCFGISSTICLILLYIYLPETKDKSLHEIADSIRGENSSKEEDKLNPSDA